MISYPDGQLCRELCGKQLSYVLLCCNPDKHMKNSRCSCNPSQQVETQTYCVPSICPMENIQFQLISTTITRLHVLQLEFAAFPIGTQQTETLRLHTESGCVRRCEMSERNFSHLPSSMQIKTSNQTCVFLPLKLRVSENSASDPISMCICFNIYLKCNFLIFVLYFSFCVVLVWYILGSTL